MLLKLIKLSSLVVIAAISAAQADPASEPKKERGTQIVRHETSGNLEVTNDLDCQGLDDLSDQYTPADLYAATAKCFGQEDYDSAAQLFALAGTYGMFDQQRVADKSAHQAIQMMQSQLFQSSSPENKSKLRDNFVEHLSPGTPQLARVCDQIREIGAPDYFPRYMIQHGIRAFGPEQPNRGLIDDFSADKAWETALTTYLHCPTK